MNTQEHPLYGLVGHPLGHSFSRNFFTHKFQNEGIDAEYLNFDIAHIEELPQIISRYPTLHGLNVTLPYKQAVLPLLHELSPEAAQIGAVNVISVRHTSQGLFLKGHNSDAIGFRRSLLPLLRPHHTDALVLGTGGASRAVAFVLNQLGIHWQHVSRTALHNRLTYQTLTPNIVRAHLLIINCSPLGMYPHDEGYPPIPYQALTPKHLLFDLVYNPSVTRFMTQGQAQGATTKNGLEMLHFQAVASWDYWQDHDDAPLLCASDPIV